MKQNILVIDDSTNISELVSEILSTEEIIIIKANNGKLGLKKARAIIPDLILLDIMMPEIDGFEVCKILKNDDKTKDIPVIFMSALVEKEDIIKGLRLGAVDYVKKPFNEDELQLRINIHLELLKPKKKLKKETEIRKKTEKKLQKSEKRFRNLFLSVPVGLYRTDKNGQIIEANPALVKMLNYPNRKTLLNTNVKNIFVDPNKRDDEIKLLTSRKTVTSYSFQLYKYDGNIISVLDSARIIKNKEGEILCYEGSMINITEREKVQRALKESEEKYRILFEKSNDAILLIDNDRFVDCNSSVIKMLGYKKKSDLLNKHPAELSPEIQPDGRQSYEKAKEMIAIASKKGNYKFEWVHTRANGEDFPVEVWLTAIPYHNKKIIHTVWRDLTQRKKNEQRIQRKNNKLKEAYIELIKNKEEIETAHKDIIANIKYAKSIQNALLTSKKLIDAYINNYFLLFNPKEEVSGDFYYINKINDYIIFAVADCTGHGVTGGFLTVIGITYLHEIVRKKEVSNSSEVLNILRQRLKETFRTFGSENQNGLDIAFCAINTKTNILQYSGAYNPLWIIRNNELLEYKATRNPIGFHYIEMDFICHEIQLQNNDLIYLFSDGFFDQINEEERKFTKKRFRELLLKEHSLPFNKQKIVLEQEFKKWKGNCNQIDDVTVMGVKRNV